MDSREKEPAWKGVSGMPDFPAMRREWLAWRALCLELEDLGVDINAQSRLAAAIRLWGEELVSLREKQHWEVVARALHEARRDYDPGAMERSGRIP